MLCTTANVRKCTIPHEIDVFKRDYEIPLHIMVTLSCDDKENLGSVCSYRFKKYRPMVRVGVKPHHTDTFSGFKIVTGYRENFSMSIFGSCGCWFVHWCKSGIRHSTKCFMANRLHTESILYTENIWHTLATIQRMLASTTAVTTFSTLEEGIFSLLVPGKNVQFPCCFKLLSHQFA